MKISDAGSICSHLAAIYSRPGLEAADIKQELLIKWLEVNSPEASDPYIRKCLRNKAIDMVRALRRNERFMDRGFDISWARDRKGDDKYEPLGLRGALEPALTDRELVVMGILASSAEGASFSSAMTQAEISDASGLSRTTVSRVLESIRIKASVIIRLRSNKRQLARAAGAPSSGSRSLTEAAT
jgi:CRP-like cAMP-binding protein